MAQLIDILLLVGLIYILLGILFSVYFYATGARKIDEGTAGTPWHFKLIIFPGVILFWSVLLTKTLRSR